MLRMMLPAACLLFLNALPVHAAFSQFYFAGNNGSSSNPRTCPGNPFGCEAPKVCAFDDRIAKWYCCDADGSDAVCWGPNVGCDGGNQHTPSGSQQVCSSGDNAFCCLKSSQVNICWSTLKDPLATLNVTAVNETAHSLEAASPSAATYSISLSALLALTSTTAAPSSVTGSPSGKPSSSAGPSASATPAASSSTPTGKSSGLSGGAIGGIVGGVVGGLALLGIAGILLWRRRQKKQSNPYEPANMNSPTMPPHSPAQLPANAVMEMDAHQPYSNVPVTEKYGHEVAHVAEAPAERPIAELPAN
ncbi:transmembrane alpha-helix domain-containing [Pyrenophora seminiperda CCB06]|uniref:Transmembrane alpha-helix domain-containing n=1 Tax=Pyrenophora seminiperda CCB06 TaxID=1302712 RepID=A0A3M7MBR0_9PLEO|nr:transmembrane alpha-helix domain-containing [Pyrenophora seminiperda CCB06]